MPLPVENLDTKSFNELVREALKQIPIHAPQWTDYNYQDPGVTLIELFAWLTEMQLYQLNQVPDAVYRKFLTLMGIPGLYPARPAQVILTFTPVKTSNVSPLVIPKGTKAAAPFPGKEILFETLEPLQLKDRPGTVHARQVNTMPPVSFSSDGLPHFSIQLEHAPVQEVTVTVYDRAKNRPFRWRQVDDFNRSRPGNRCFTFDSTTGIVSFGDGVRGRIPPAGDHNITVSYSFGGGEAGNVMPHTISRVKGDIRTLVTVDNPEAASGGKEPETLDQAIQRLRKDLTAIHRAVTCEDYQYIALNTPGNLIARAKANPRFHPLYTGEISGLVTIVVVPRQEEDTPESLQTVAPHAMTSILQSVYNHLDNHRLLSTRLLVIPPQYVTVHVSTSVVFHPEYLDTTVSQSVRRQLERFLHPLTGGLEGTGWEFGRPVYLSEIYNIIHNTDGVDYVESLQLSGSRTDRAGDLLIPPTGLAVSGEHRIKAREKGQVAGGNDV